MAICRPSEQYLNQLRGRYRKARKKERSRILDEFVATTGYHRKHAIALLRGKRQHHNPKVPIRHLRRRIYNDEDKRAVMWLAELFDQIGSKRLRIAMDVELKALRQHHHLPVAGVFNGCASLVHRRWIACGARSDVSQGIGVAAPSPARSSNNMFKSAPLPIGTINVRGSRKSIWCNMMAVIPVVFSLARST